MTTDRPYRPDVEDGSDDELGHGGGYAAGRRRARKSPGSRFAASGSRFAAPEVAWKSHGSRFAPADFGHLDMDCYVMRIAAVSELAFRFVPTESAWSLFGVALESPEGQRAPRRAHKSRSRVVWPRPISAPSMWIVLS